MEFLTHLLYLLNEMSPYILLGFLIAGILHAFIPRAAMARHLSGSGWKAVVKSALVGVPLPLCSCGVLPTSIAMHRNGASKASTTSFLIATPQTGVDSISATWAMLGPAFAVIRPVAALVTAVGGGIAVGKSDKTARSASVCQTECLTVDSPQANPSLGNKIISALKYGFVDLVGSIGGWLVVGLIIAALITVFVPADFFTFLGKTPIVAMLAVLVIAIPMYVCATGSIPIALSLVMKGLSPGTALVLLMAGPAANFASFTLISREIGKRAAFVYISSIVVGALVFGLAIDYLMPASWFTAGDITAACHDSHFFTGFPTLCSAVLVGLLIYSLIRNMASKYKTNKISTNMTKEFTIKGMNCSHCRATVEKTIANVAGVTSVDVNLSTGKAFVEGDFNEGDLVRAVHDAGFDVVTD